MGIDDTLVEDGIGQVVNQHLDADVRRPRVFLLLRSRVLLFPFRLTLTVGLVALLDVLHEVLDGFLDGTLTNRLPTYQHIHKGGFVLHIVPVAEPHAMQMDTQCREYRISYGGLVEPGHVLRQQPYQRRQPFRHRRRSGQRTATGLHACLRFHGLQHLLQPIRHPLPRLLQRVLQRLPIFSLTLVLWRGAGGEAPVVGYDRHHFLQRVSADATDGHRQFEGQRITVALHGFLAAIEELPVLLDDILIQHPVVLRLRVVDYRWLRADG